MQFLQGQGVKIPEEISIAGFDDCPLCDMVCPSLTTVQQNGQQRAQMAVDMLKELRKKDEEGTMITLPVTLVKRQSVQKVRNSKNKARYY